MLSAPAQQAPILTDGLILDLDAARGVELGADHKVLAWHNQATAFPKLVFIPQDKGREIAGSGRPGFQSTVPQLNGHPSLVFKQQELICMDEDVFDGLITGKGYTWTAVIKVYPQRVGVKNVNSFFGNLRNGKFYEGIWGCLNDDNSIWIGSRNGLSFGRFDKNNPQVSGPVLEQTRFHLVAGRMEAGTGEVNISLYVDTPQAVSSEKFPVNIDANASRMAIGQERDAIEHPGKESFDGEIARFLIWERPLTTDELASTMTALQKNYLLKR